MSTRRPRRARAAAGSGQALAEFALVFPVFVLLLAGMIDFGLGLYSYMGLISAAREGGRLAVTNCKATDCAGAVSAKAQAASNGLNPSVTVACATTAGTAEQCSASSSGDTVTVTLSYTYRMVWPLTFGTQIPMASSVKMLIE